MVVRSAEETFLFIIQVLKPDKKRQCTYCNSRAVYAWKNKGLITARRASYYLSRTRHKSRTRLLAGIGFDQPGLIYAPNHEL